MMSGRGRKGRGGYGRGSGNYSRRSTGKGSGGKTYVFSLHMNTKPHIATFEEIKHKICAAVHKDFEHGVDIARSIRSGTLVDLNEQMPRRRYSELEDQLARSREQADFDTDYTNQAKSYQRRRDALEFNLPRTFSMILDRFCDEGMRNRLMMLPDYNTKILEDPLKLLEKIKILIQNPATDRYAYDVLHDVINFVMNCKQREEEDLQTYFARFTQHCDILRSHLGVEALDNFVSHTTEYLNAANDLARATLKKEGLMRLFACVFLKGSDQRKYGSLLKTLTQQYSLKNDQYPRTLRDALDVLQNHKFDSRPNKKADDKKENTKSDKSDKSDTPTPKSEASFAQSANKFCYCCGDKSHLANKCPQKNTKPREQWFHHKSAEFVQQKTDEQKATAVSSNASASITVSPEDINNIWGVNLMHDMVEYTTSHAQTNSRDLFKLLDVVIWDSGAGTTTMANDKLMLDIRPCKPLLMGTNGGTETLDRSGIVPGLGEAYYNPTGITNVASMSQLIRLGYRVTFDSDKENAFLVYPPPKSDGNNNRAMIRFTCNEKGLYCFKPKPGFFEHIARQKQFTSTPVLVDTVQENRLGYTDRQFARAKRVRALYHILGTPTVENFKHLLRQKVIRNCPLTVEDVNIAEAIFGRDISHLKGVSTRVQPKPIRDDHVAVPPELIRKNMLVHLCIDIMYINGKPFFTSIDRSIRFRAVLPLAGRSGEELLRAIKMVSRKYNAGGFLVKTIHCDAEFQPYFEDVWENLTIEMEFTNAQDHVPEAERNNRTIQERFHAAFHRLPYKAIPMLMIRYLAMVSACQLNYYPAHGGISPYYSPHVLLGGRDLDYNQHCVAEFGSYVQACTEPDPSNTNAPRTLDAIYLRPNIHNPTMGHELMDLQTGRMITRRKVTVIPITASVITM